MASRKRAGAQVEGTVEQFTYKGGMPYLRVPRAVAAGFASAAGPARLVCTIGVTEFPCGLMPLGDGDSYIILSKKLRSALGVEVGDHVAATLAPDTSEYGLPMPEELAEALAQDEAGARAFAALTPGRKRGVLAMVARHGSVDRRVEHAVAVLQAIASGESDLKTLARARLTVGRGALE